MKRRAKIRFYTFLLIIPVLLFGFWQDSMLSLSYTETKLEYMYLRSLGDLTDYVAGMDSALQKAMYAGGPSTHSAVCAELIEQSCGAKSAMAVLPLSGENTERIDRFLSQVGDYAMALNRKVLSGSALDNKDLQNLKNLREYSNKLAAALTDLQSRLSAEQSGIVQRVSLLDNLDSSLNVPKPLAVLDDDFDAVSQEFAEFPTLLYDGPFSDHITRREPLAIRSKNTISQEQAADKAAELLGCAGGAPGQLSFSGQGGGRLPVFSFTEPGEDGAIINITCQGGEPSYFKRAGTFDTAKLGYKEALAAAREYLAGMGFEELKESYYLINDNMCTINFHSLGKTSDGQQVICYPDLIKVVVELSLGGTVEFDSTGYLMNAHSRDLKPPKLSESEAAAALSPHLKPKEHQLAVIPTPGLSETLCWEFLCTAADGQEALCYVNAATGQEEQLFILMRDKRGVTVV